MSPRMRIRRWLGITEIQEDQSAIMDRLHNLNNELVRLQQSMKAIGHGLGRIIAKIDANYAKNEFDPAKRAESNKIGEEVLKRLNAEAKARAPYNE